jgi:metal-sulfur cluster biosynthetic enzyme
MSDHRPTDAETEAFDDIEDVDAEVGSPSYCAYTEYEHGVDPDNLPATGDDAEGVEADVFAELYEVEDPEMPISVVDLGLIYGVAVEDGHATVTMTLTYTGCPARDYLREDVRQAAERADGVDTAEVELVWSPEWNLELVTEAGKRDLREFGVSV